MHKQMLHESARSEKRSKKEHTVAHALPVRRLLQQEILWPSCQVLKVKSKVVCFRVVVKVDTVEIEEIVRLESPDRRHDDLYDTENPIARAPSIMQ
jgi:hypothetical protein